MAERVAIVVGAAGMGEAVATRLARDGFDLILFDPSGCRDVATRIDRATERFAEQSGTRFGKRSGRRSGRQAGRQSGAEHGGGAGDIPGGGPGEESGDGPAYRPAAKVLAAFGSLADPADLRRALPFVLREAGHDAVDAVVYTLLPDDAFAPRSLASLSSAEWDRLAEEPVRQGLTVLQVAHEFLLPRKGRFVFVLPSVALEGGAGLVPLATAAEALRALGKSAARRWAAAGLTVNFVLADVFAYGAEQLRGTDVDRGEAVRPAPTTADEVADTVALFLAPDAAALTGATLTVDGGALMTP